MTSHMKADEEVQEEGKEAVQHSKHRLDLHGYFRLVMINMQNGFNSAGSASWLRDLFSSKE